MTSAKRPGRKTETSADQSTNCVTLASLHFTTNMDKLNSNMLDNLGTSKLLVGVSRPDDLTLRVGNHRKSGEAVVGAKDVAPARGDGEVAAGGRAGGALLGGAGALDVVAALVGLAVAGVDAELPVADGVVGAAVALGVADGPLGGGGHHVDGLFLSGGS
ncbi:hypothetical protein HG531_000019 [Fusarium graminearum]|nr:hypothetical protein HG531_000019 [Fusarium graminearum]